MCKEKEGVELSSGYVRGHVKLFYAAAQCKLGVEKNSVVSVGWFMHCLKRKELNHAKFIGERAFADDEAACDYPEVLKEIIDEEGYSPDLIYNVDKMVWRPRSTCGPPQSCYKLRPPHNLPQAPSPTQPATNSAHHTPLSL
ncbi:hypothetical protein Pcinc_000230 [Petrolisthes cinctipes]|uniref:Uncharacterized protein n=1 Tax=Petrolisthes cinctipes TaxID=88211 RepID=A0AAE1GNP8_PETCI|nr:hypothetical protein Pcinc_000230 [Petrolisthes cinctipes]